MHLVPHLEQIAHKGPGCGARRSGQCVVQLGVLLDLLDPGGYQDQVEKKQSSSNRGQRGRRLLAD